VQADLLAQLGEADAVAVARDLFEDRKSAAERLHADALRALDIAVAIGTRGRDQARRLGRSLWFGPRDRLLTRLGFRGCPHRWVSRSTTPATISPLISE